MNLIRIQKLSYEVLDIIVAKPNSTPSYQFYLPQMHFYSSVEDARADSEEESDDDDDDDDNNDEDDDNFVVFNWRIIN